MPPGGGQAAPGVRTMGGRSRSSSRRLVR
jgi:hypothetical protein